ncbi:MAG: phenylalanine--tRNA ligase subunit alpha [Christensenellaceae bacterium]|jgi:phenylalanyl-tRNA synthetase alpha chain|nr:phenylalanine--tRNA ligase subunit alpha [Christensenellaceae bacterium]
MKQNLEHILNELKASLSKVATSAECQNLKVKVLGKSGSLTEILKNLKDVPSAERPVLGSLINTAKTQAEEWITEKETSLKKQETQVKLMSEKVDVTLSKRGRERGNLHPLSLDLIKLCNVMKGLGFSQIDGPEIDLDKFNFELVNLPKDHPARDMQDTFYITENILLRTQTSNAQPRAMQNIKLPFKAFCPGRCFRRDEYDATHTPSFFQFEGIYIDEKVSMVDLKATLDAVARQIMGEDVKIKLRGSYFPFTEPSVEGDIVCSVCMGKGCSACKNTGGFELFGAGMIHPKVLEMNGIDSKKYSGFAFGFGFDRVVKNHYKIPYSRLMYENDIRFLKQFR